MAPNGRTEGWSDTTPPRTPPRGPHRSACETPACPANSVLPLKSACPVRVAFRRNRTARALDLLRLHSLHLLLAPETASVCGDRRRPGFATRTHSDLERLLHPDTRTRLASLTAFPSLRVVSTPKGRQAPHPHP